ncbi:hypothetical protein V6N11_018300 [Hibiscus sabdariffa]|uniref:Secreted protein n=1 Tax=Hibiscus sabdariffa TaxID=183260 RepID=A0ABR2T6Z9_9ROSI
MEPRVRSTSSPVDYMVLALALVACHLEVERFCMAYWGNVKVDVRKVACKQDLATLRWCGGNPSLTGSAPFASNAIYWGKTPCSIGDEVPPAPSV